MMGPDRKAEAHRGEHPRALCSHKHRELLLPYALTGCNREQGLAFEAHMLSCDACFDDLKSLDLAAALIGDPNEAKLTLSDLFYNPLLKPGATGRPHALPESMPRVTRRSMKA